MEKDLIVGQLVHPFTYISVGPSAIGKTTMLLDLIENKDELICGKIDKVVWVYGVDQEAYHKFAEKHNYIEFTTDFEPSTFTSGTLVVLDDLQTSITSGPLRKTIQDFVIRSVSHSSVSIILVLHNLFCPQFRTISLSTTYISFFNTIRDSNTISTLGRQAFGQYGSFLKDAFNYIVSKNSRGYVFLDFSVQQSNKFRVRDNIYASKATFFVPV